MVFPVKKCDYILTHPVLANYGLYWGPRISCVLVLQHNNLNPKL